MPIAQVFTDSTYMVPILGLIAFILTMFFKVEKFSEKRTFAGAMNSQENYLTIEQINEKYEKKKREEEI